MDKKAARSLPIEEDGKPEVEREEWACAAVANLPHAYGRNELDYSVAAIIEPNPNYRP